MRQTLLAADPTIPFGDWYSKLSLLKSSELLECLDVMPKPAVHHVHLTASVEIDFIVEKLLYYDHVYFNQKENMFKTNKNGVDLPGYVKVNDLRLYWNTSNDFDAYMRKHILMAGSTVKLQEHHMIWKEFQPKFFLTNDLYNYHEFFEKILYEATRRFTR